MSIRVRRGTAADATTANPTLEAGEFGYETDTGKFKVGNGSTAWNSLSYSNTAAGIGAEAALGNPASNGYVLASTTAGVRSWVAPSSISPASTVSTQAYGDAGTVGTATTYAREDHKHAMPASTKDTTAATGILKGNGSVVSAAVAGDFPTLNQNTTGSAGLTVASVTFDTTGGAASGSTFNGSVAKTIDYSTVGAAASGHTHTGVYEPANTNIQSHISNTSNPHSTTAAQVGADPSGTATGLMATHTGASDPHTQYALESTLGTAAFTASTDYAAASHNHTGVYDPSGTASSAITTHTTAYDHTKIHNRLHTVTDTNDHTFPGGTTTFLRADGTFATPASSGGGAGTAVINFGSAPGTNVVTATVTGQTGIVAGSQVQAFMMAEPTATHNAYEHTIAPIRLICGNISAGAGFDIIASTDLRLTGTFNVRWNWV